MLPNVKKTKIKKSEAGEPEGQKAVRPESQEAGKPEGQEA
ncbi:hypothetical protein D1AOALGA4SA_3973 [Olavius algarvensis Delta 1 endosymbiont]|nr:hypothetical protein D1AOALGA4SA_3973 [Olavius algarvensis Delta 1 endosymbiont]